MGKNLGSFLIVFFVGFLFYFLQPGFVEDVENRILDYRFNARERLVPDQRVVIVGIDQNSLSKLDMPFFTFGSVFAEIADSAVDFSAAGLLFDLVFPASSEKAIKEHVASVSRTLKIELPHSFYRELGFERSFRASLIRLKNSGLKLIIGFAWEKNQGFSSDKAILRIAGAESTGYFNLPVDRDGKIRKAMLYSSSRANGTVNSVAMLGASAVASFVPPVESGENCQINYCGPSGSFRTIPLMDLLESYRNGVSLESELKDKIVLVGFTDITDFKSTPFGYMPGVEIHANIIDNLLNHRFLKKLDERLEIFLVTVLAFIVCFVISYSPIRGILVGLILAVGWAIVGYSFSAQVWIPIFRPVGLLVFLAAIETIAYMRKISKDRNRIKAIFGRYVSDSVLNEILTASDQDFISGRRRCLCILMADIRGFTSFSEKREAAEVVTFLNAYFAEVTSIIMKHNGVVDKFLGDGLLAFYNAPVEQKDFVHNAVQSAIEIGKFSNSDEFRKISGDVDLKVGIALHIGPVVFGNIGSEKKAEFTVIGDAVNTCSRMESMNKEFDTEIIVSADVVEKCRLGVEWKLLGKRTLRGKTEELSLYTIV